MKLYYAPGACSLADHIALHEAGLSFDAEQVDLKAGTTAHGEDWAAVNPKGYVPALTLDSGETLTENIAILDWIAHHHQALRPGGPLGHTHLLEVLAYISTEIHKSFKPFFKPGATDAEKQEAAALIGKRLAFIAARLKGDYLFGGAFSVADAYLFVMLMWAGKRGVPIPEPLPAYVERVRARAAVATALRHEGLD